MRTAKRAASVPRLCVVAGDVKRGLSQKSTVC